VARWIPTLYEGRRAATPDRPADKFERNQSHCSMISALRPFAIPVSCVASLGRCPFEGGGRSLRLICVVVV